MNKRRKTQIILRISKIHTAAETEILKAVSDIKRNWVDGLNEKFLNDYLKLKGKSNVSQLTSFI